MAHYLTIDDVCRINEAEVGPNLLADLGLLESAVLRPQQSVGGRDAYEGLAFKAAALFHSLVNNHAFVDGNKRTAVLAVIVFHNINGWQLLVEEGALIELAVDTAEGHLQVPQIAARFLRWTAPLPLPEE